METGAGLSRSGRMAGWGWDRRVYWQEELRPIRNEHLYKTRPGLKT